LSEEIKNKVKFLIVLGETADKIKNLLQEKGFEKVKKVKDLREAVNFSFNIAERGDIVLFSPACSSFDMFRDYRERGEKFKRIVFSL
ncbi:MAG: UDP-N-acetylmuramoyl-L-alanine--D-glutamate ligase, partial [Candidatus Bathyarchaeia archaeon]